MDSVNAGNSLPYRILYVRLFIPGGRCIPYSFFMTGSVRTGIKKTDCACVPLLFTSHGSRPITNQHGASIQDRLSVVEKPSLLSLTGSWHFFPACVWIYCWVAAGTPALKKRKSARDGTGYLFTISYYLFFVSLIIIYSLLVFISILPVVLSLCRNPPGYWNAE